MLDAWFEGGCHVLPLNTSLNRIGSARSIRPKTNEIRRLGNEYAELNRNKMFRRFDCGSHPARNILSLVSRPVSGRLFSASDFH